MRNLMRIVAVLVGLLQATIAIVSNKMNPDGVCYLDMGDAFLRQDWNLAINSVWSPLYSWLLGVPVNLLQPGIRVEYGVVHIVNLLIYVVTIACFEFFWRQVTVLRRQKSGVDAGTAFPEAAWTALGYTVFIFSSIRLIGVELVTPDMTMAAFVYLAAGVMLKIRMGLSGRPAYAAFGFLLGLAYLTKSIMFPMAFVFLLACILPGRSSAPGRRWIWLALACFLLVAGPWVLALSLSKGRLTFGDAGNVTYAKSVSKVPYPHWQGEPAGHGSPEHPSRRIMLEPDIYEFGEPVGGTYPISYDSSYWYEGLKTRFDLRRQSEAVARGGWVIFDVLVRRLGVVFYVTAVLHLVSRRQRDWKDALSLEWSLILPGLTAMTLYALVHIEHRYIAVFTTLVMAGILCNIRAPTTTTDKRSLTGGIYVMMLVIWLNMGAFEFNALAAAVGMEVTVSPGTAANGGTLEDKPWQVAEALQDSGITRGDRVGFIGYSNGAFWARLLRVKIVAEITTDEAGRFWCASPARQEEALQAFEALGVRAVVSETVPPLGAPEGWEPVANTGHIIHRFR